MAVKNKYDFGGAAIASYDWFDIENGVGYVTYYGLKSRSSWALTTNIIGSDKVETRGTAPADDSAVVFEADFDLNLNNPKTIKGMLLVSAAGYAEGSGTPTEYVYFEVKLRKWDGADETEIAYGSSAILKQVQGTGINHEKRFLIEVPVPRTHYKKGETIRVTILGHAWGTPASQVRYAFGHDPKSREATDESSATDLSMMGTETQLIVDIPYEVDL